MKYHLGLKKWATVILTGFWSNLAHARMFLTMTPHLRQGRRSLSLHDSYNPRPGIVTGCLAHYIIPLYNPYRTPLYIESIHIYIYIHICIYIYIYLQPVHIYIYITPIISVGSEETPTLPFSTGPDPRRQARLLQETPAAWLLSW